MASSYIQYKGNGFWTYDNPICVIAAYLYLEIMKIESMPRWLEEYGSDLRDNSYGYFVGFTSLRLDAFIVDDDRLAIILRAVEQVKNQIQHEDSIIALDRLNEYIDDNGAKIWSGRKVEKIVVEKMLCLLVDILNGKEVDQDLYLKI